MMCLGWGNRKTCRSRPQYVLDGPGAESSASCPSTNWVLMSLVAIGLGAMLKKR